MPSLSESAEEVTVGVVVERRPATSRWQRWRWRALEVVPGLTGYRWQALPDARFAAGGLALRLHRSETEDYRYALSADPPQLYVVLRPDEAEPVPFRPFLVTASPWEAQAYAEAGEAQVDAVPMPEALVAGVTAFVARHHVDRPFLKRRRKGRDQGMADPSEFEPVDRSATP